MGESKETLREWILHGLEEYEPVSPGILIDTIVSRTGESYTKLWAALLSLLKEGLIRPNSPDDPRLVMGRGEEASEGVKLDEAKPRWDLLPPLVLTEVVRVLTYGAEKYDKHSGPENWKRVPDARRRYYAASMRHVTAWWEGEKKDPETGLHHLAHATSCLLFLLWFDLGGDDAGA